ncbi:MAG: 2-phosphosulfolactate phosphatase family protein [Marinilabiliales bacterium]
MTANIETCFSPALFHLYNSKNAHVVVVDILRATSVITTMFINGVEKVIPVKDLDTAREFKKKGYLVVAERDGKKLDFADFGNSPLYFTPEIVKGKTLVYSTTNGTNAITIGKNSKSVIIGSYLNFTAILRYLEQKNDNILLLCAGWKDKFNLEDTLFCGALASKLLENKRFSTICDSTLAAIDLWNLAKKDVLKYIDKVAQRNRLKKIGLDNVIPYCHDFDRTEIIPVFTQDAIIKLI